MDLEECKNRIDGAEAMVKDAYAAIAPEKLKERRAYLAERQNDPSLYSDPKAAQSVNSEAKYIDNTFSKFDKLFATASDLRAMAELLEIEADAELSQELFTETDAFCAEAEKAQISALLKGEYDKSDAILSLHAGAGGTEAQDWVSMLFRMYRMYCEKVGYTVEVLDRLDGDEAGIKSITFVARGMNAYGFLKAEMGVHRLVRISPFDANARRHTSFASLEVMPEIKDDTTVTINPDDIRVDTFRSSGAGGQHINKTDSAIRITHFPTGIVVTCQQERSQTQNREMAFTMLKSKLVELKEREALEKASSLKGEVKKIEWGSQIRSYVFQPYTLVKDHRTGYENSDIQSVMDGDLEGFIIDYLKKTAG
ncbi:MAG: peptide chain release factor 2 [Clostridiales bacterium]|nr:peptide chain release factor 2 [Clostridiales bacterium]